MEDWVRKKTNLAVLILCLCLFVLQLPAQTFTEFNETGRLSMLAKAWGFLKYYHPQKQQTHLDWDETLIQAIPTAKLAQNAEEFSEVILGMLNNAGGINPIDFSSLTPADAASDPFYLWMKDRRFFTPGTRYLMNIVLANLKGPNSLTQYSSLNIIEPRNETPFTPNPYPSEELRLLSLFRFWNIIHHFFPYKNLMDEPWDSVLLRMIPIFIQAGNQLEYALAVRELTARIDDSHAFLVNSVLENHYWGSYYPPFLTETIENEIVVTTLLEKNDNTISVGDIILSADGMDVNEFRKQNIKYLAASNTAVIERELNSFIFRGKDQMMQLTLDRLGQKLTVQIQRIDSSRYWNLYDETQLGPVFKNLENDIAYIHMGRLTQDMVTPIMSGLMSKRAIIFDIRNYPQGTMYDIAEWLNGTSIPFAKFTKPNPRRPGFFLETDPYRCGPNYKKQHYEGKVILLFNEKTQSHAEFTCMALQTAPDVTSIGSQTAGADGNVARISLPGGFWAYFTALGVYYPDGRETQRIGIVPDIVVTPTIQGIRAGVDEVLERAIAFILQN